MNVEDNNIKIKDIIIQNHKINNNTSTNHSSNNKSSKPDNHVKPANHISNQVVATKKVVSNQDASAQSNHLIINIAKEMVDTGAVANPINLFALLLSGIITYLCRKD